MDQISPAFKPKDSRFGMARLDSVARAEQPVVAAAPAAVPVSAEQRRADIALPPIRKVAQSAETRSPRAFSTSLFGRLLGADIVEASAQRVCARLTVRRDLCRADGVLESSALFALADMVVSVGMNLAHGGSVCRILETKTHIFEAAIDGSVLVVDAAPLHAGSGATVWQTRVASGGKQIALVLQTCLAG